MRALLFLLTLAAFLAAVAVAMPPATLAAALDVAGLGRAPVPAGTPELSPRRRAAGHDYAPPEGRFARHETADGTFWHLHRGRGAGPTPPLVLLLHGSNRDGRSMLDMWQAVADREGLLLVAPDSADPAGWDTGRENAAHFARLLDELAQRASFDATRVYLFGHSAGAVNALRLAAAGPGPWRAVAVHAGAVEPPRVRSHAAAAPVLIQLGEADHLFPVDDVRRGAAALAAGGHDVTLTLIPGHDHWFYAIGPRLAEAAWDFFEEHALA